MDFYVFGCLFCDSLGDALFLFFVFNLDCLFCSVNLEAVVEEEVQNLHQDVFKGFETTGNDVIDEIGIVESEKEKKKKKRKRKGAKDLRFEMEALAGISTKRKERKKK